MDKTLPPIILNRDEAAEILRELAHVTEALGLLPHRTALDPIRRLGDVCDTLQAAFPGGYAGPCVYCDAHIGIDEIGSQVFESGDHACRICRSEIEAGDVDAVDQAKAEAKAMLLDVLRPFVGKIIAKDTPAEMAAAIVKAFPPLELGAFTVTLAVEDEAARAAVEGDGWVDWNGGECPLHPDVRVEVRGRFGAGSTEQRAGDLHWGRDPKFSPILAYRLALAKGPEPTANNHREAGEFGDGATVVTERLVPRYDQSAKINWGSHAEAAQAIRDGYLPEGYRVEDGVLIVPGAELRPWRGATALDAAFSEIRTATGVILKSRNGPAAPDIGPGEIQLLRQLLRGPISTFHSATIGAATRLRGDDLVMTYELAAPCSWGVEITAKGKRHLEAAGGAQ